MAFQIIRHDITKVKADAIVNTANPAVAVGAGVDFAIYEAAGRKQLLEARAKIGRLEIGEVGITPAFHLSAKYIIHSSGPVWRDGKYKEPELLRQCYDKALRLAAKYGCKSIAFPLMSTGSYGFPKELGIQIAVEAFRHFLQEQDMEITLVVFGSHAYKVSGGLFDNVQAFVNDRYVSNAYRYEYGHPGSPAPERRNAWTQAWQLNEECIDEYYDEDYDDDYYEEGLSGDFKADQETGNALKTAPRQQEGSFVRSVSEKLKSMSLEERLKRMYTKSFEKYLQQLINKKGMKNSEVYAAANISKQYFSKLLNGKVKPSKGKVLSLAIGLRLNIDETVDLLKVAGYALSPVSQTDVVVEYFIQHQDYNVMKIDIVLFDYGLPLLSE